MCDDLGMNKLSVRWIPRMLMNKSVAGKKFMKKTSNKTRFTSMNAQKIFTIKKSKYTSICRKVDGDIFFAITEAFFGFRITSNIYKEIIKKFIVTICKKCYNFDHKILLLHDNCRVQSQKAHTFQEEYQIKKSTLLQP